MPLKMTMMSKRYITTLQISDYKFVKNSMASQIC